MLNNRVGLQSSSWVFKPLWIRKCLYKGGKWGDFTKAAKGRVMLPHTVRCHRIQQRSTACHCTRWRRELTWPLATCKGKNAHNNLSSAAVEPKNLNWESRAAIRLQPWHQHCNMVWLCHVKWCQAPLTPLRSEAMTSGLTFPQSSTLSTAQLQTCTQRGRFYSSG